MRYNFIPMRQLWSPDTSGADKDMEQWTLPQCCWFGCSQSVKPRMAYDPELITRYISRVIENRHLKGCAEALRVTLFTRLKRVKHLIVLQKTDGKMKCLHAVRNAAIEWNRRPVSRLSR